MKHRRLIILACMLFVMREPGLAQITPRVESIRVPRSFVLNDGQWDARVKAASIGYGPTVSFSNNGYSVAVIPGSDGGKQEQPRPVFSSMEMFGTRVDLRPAQSGATVAPLRLIDGSANQARESLLPATSSLTYAQAWKGIDVRVEGDAGELRHEIHVAARADPSQVKLHFENVSPGALQVESGDAAVNPIIRQTSDGTTEITLGGGYVRPYAFTVTVGFTLFHGGTKNESNPLVRVDSEGNPTLAGSTISPDFPLVPADSLLFKFTYGDYVVKISPDGRTVIHSTVFSYGFYGNSVRDMEIGINDRTILLVWNTNLANLLTPDARDTIYSPYGFIILDPIGAREYVSYIQTQTLQLICDMAVGANGDVFLFAHTYYTPPMVTDDAYLNVLQGIEDGFIMKYSSCDWTLTYATLMGGPGHEEYQCIAVGDHGEVVVSGATSRPGYPIVNPLIPTPPNSNGAVITKLASEHGEIDYSSYLSEAYAVYSGYGRRAMRFDSTGNLYFAFQTNAPGFPIVRGFKIVPTGSSDIVMGCISPRGQILFSTYFGGSGTDQFSEMDVDACGRIIISGQSNSADLPQVGAIANKTSVATSPESFIAVIDPTTASVLFCSWYGGSAEYSLSLHERSLFLASATTGTNMQPTPGMPGPNPGGNDLLLTRLDIPGICPRPAISPPPPGLNTSLTVDLDAVDTLFVDTLRRIAAPSVCVLRARITNVDSIATSDSLRVLLNIPGVIQLLNGSAPSELYLSSIAPGDSRVLEWFFHAPFDTLLDPASLRFFLRVSPNAPCPVTASGTRSVRVVLMDLASTEVHCSIKSFPQLESGIKDLRLANDTLHVLVHVRNLGDEPAPIKALNLVVQPGTGVFSLTPLQRTFQQLPPRSDREELFSFRVLSWQFYRDVFFKAVLVDTFDLITQYCELTVTIPGVHGTVCSTISPPTVRWDPMSGRSDPMEFGIGLTIENPADTVRFYTVERLDMSRAPHLQLATGEVERRDRFYVNPGFRRLQQWRFAVLPPIDHDVSDTVGLVYITEADGKEHRCEAIVNIRVQRGEILCTLDLPDSLHIDSSNGLLSQTDFTATMVLHNVGSIPLPLKEADILLPPDGMIALLDARLKGLRQLAAGERDTVSWSLRALSSPTERLSSIGVVAYAPDASEAARCEKTIFIPAVGIPCLVLSPDTVHYDMPRGEYVTDPFDVTLRLRNPTDTALVNVRARLDTASLKRSRLVGPAMPVRVLPLLNAGSSVDVTWKLTPLWAATDEEERYIVSIDIGDRDIHSACDAATLIEGGPRYVSLHCSTAGHDTIWADNFYEALIPDPLQLQYTVRNTGTMISKPCRIAIVLPPVLVLAAGEDSVKMIPALLPGASASAEWMLDIVESQAAAGTVAVRWIADCDGQETPLSCESTVTITARDPDGIVLTPWLLRFTAEHLGALPASKSVTLWTGGGPTPAWSVAQSPSWLSTIPLDGNARTVMNVQPVTTDLPIGKHYGKIELHPAPITPGDIQVVYSIVSPLSVAAPRPVEGVALYDSHPNPVVRGERTTVPYSVPVGSVSRISVRDVLGREILSRTEAASADGQGSIVIDTDRLRSGVYFISLRTASGEATRSFVVLP